MHFGQRAKESIGSAERILAGQRRFRMIALQPFADDYWAKLDAKLPVEWNNDGNTPASIELQLGKNLNKRVALYTDFLAGLSDDRAYDWGLGVGIRFKY